MKFKSNIKIIALLLFSINTLLMAQENKNDKLTIISLLENYQKAINTNNLEYFKPIISQNFMIGNSPPMSSYVDAYLVITLKDSTPNKILRLENFDFQFNQTNDTVQIEFDKIFSFGIKKTQNAKVTFIQENNKWKLDKFIKGFRTRTTNYSLTVTFKMRVDTIYSSNEFQIIDPSVLNFITKNKYKIYYDDTLKHEAAKCLDLLIQIDSIIRKRLGFPDMFRQHIVLTTMKGTFMIIGNEVIWTISLPDNNPNNKNYSILKELIRVTAHEITEATLVDKYGMLSIQNRWYRDGMADYAAYIITKQFNSEIFEDYFIKGRYNQYKKHKRKGNLLDWRGTGAIDKEEGKLIAEKFIYANDFGQYGRALQFFIDLVNDYGENIIIKIHKQLEGKKNLSAKKILSVMSKITGEDIRERISEY